MAIVVTPEERRLASLYAQLICEVCGSPITGYASTINDLHRWARCGHQGCMRCSAGVWMRWPTRSGMLPAAARRLSGRRFATLRPIPKCPLCIALSEKPHLAGTLVRAFNVDQLSYLVSMTMTRVNRRSWWGIPRAWAQLTEPEHTTTVWDADGEHEIAFRAGRRVEPTPAELPDGIVRFPTKGSTR